MIDPTRGARDERTRELISTFRSADSEFERSKALEDVTRLHLPLARSLAHRYSGKGIERDDLEQVAFLALLKAVHRFDLAQTTEFGAYATPTITGELRRHFRDHGWLVRPPRSLQERRQLVTDSRSRLEQSLGHEPNPVRSTDAVQPESVLDVLVGRQYRHQVERLEYAPQLVAPNGSASPFAEAAQVLPGDQD